MDDEDENVTNSLKTKMPLSQTAIWSLLSRFIPHPSDCQENQPVSKKVNLQKIKYIFIIYIYKSTYTR